MYFFRFVGDFLLSEKVTDFIQLANGDIKPSKILEQRFAQPVSAGAITYYGGPGSNLSNYKINQKDELKKFGKFDTKAKINH